MKFSRRQFMKSGLLLSAAVVAQPGPAEMARAKDSKPPGLLEVGKVFWRDKSGKATKLNVLEEAPEDAVFLVRVSEAGFDRLSQLPDDWKARIAALHLHGRSVTSLDFLGENAGPWRQLERLALSRVFLTDDQFASIGSASNTLRTLEITTSQISDGALVHLDALTQLATLAVCQCPITDAGILKMKPMANLRAANLSRLRICDSTVSALPEMFPSLESLNLNVTRIGDNAMGSLAKLGALKQLALCQSTITNEGLAAVAALGNLESLDVSWSYIKEVGTLAFHGLARLGLDGLAGATPSNTLSDSFPKLRRLSLRNNYVDSARKKLAISDDWVAQLARLPMLEKLLVSPRSLASDQLIRFQHERSQNGLAPCSVDTGLPDELWRKEVEMLGDTSTTKERRNQAITLLAVDYANAEGMLDAMLERAREEITYVSPEGYINARVLNTCAVLLRMNDESFQAHLRAIGEFAQEVLIKNAGRPNTMKYANDVLARCKRFSAS